MRTPRSLVLIAALAAVALAPAAESTSPLAWPEITRENKPWTRWWWPGSGVDKASLTRQLEQFAAAGLGGVEITPIYGAKGYESRYIEFLSPKWMEILEHVGREAQRLGLGADMATGTGWPFGGPWVDESNALQRAVLRDGRIVGEPSKMLVKRAAPGGEGLAVDPFSPDALRRSARRSPVSRAASCAASSTTRSSIFRRAGPPSSPRFSARCTATTSSSSPPRSLPAIPPT
jgi:hypothetical protein